MLRKAARREQLRAIARASAGHACAVERALSIVGAKWTLLILHNLTTGTKRFGELQRAVRGASAKMLARRLRDMEEIGLVTRAVSPDAPPRVTYALTDAGRTLQPIIDSLALWGRRLERQERPLARACRSETKMNRRATPRARTIGAR